MASPTLALLIALGSPPPAVDIAADRLEATPEGWSADGLRLTLDGDRITAAAARGQPTAACAEGQVSLRDARITRGRQSGEAADARLCLPGGALEADHLTLTGPRLRAAAEHARWQRGEVRADALWMSPCGCDDPPWRVSASRATLTPGEGAWLTWPVLRLGELPVLAAPVAYVPFSRRRTGFLLPRLGWDGADGLYGALPFFWAPAESVDLTLSPGWRQSPGLTVDGRLRWAAGPAEGGEIEAITAPLAGEAVVHGGGSAPIGPLRLAADGQWADGAPSWRRHRRGVFERSRRHLHADVGAATASNDLGLGLRVSRLIRLRAPGDDDDREVTAPAAWMRVGAGVGPLRVALDALAAQALRPGPDGEVFDLALHAESVQWLGPLKLRPVLAGRTRIHPATDVDPAAQSLAGMAGLEAQVAVQRRFASGLHRIALTLDGRWAVADAPETRALDHADRPLDARDAGLTLSTDLIGRRWLGHLALRAAYDGLASDRGPLSARVRLTGPWIALDADGALVRDGAGAWIQARVGPTDGLRVHLGAQMLDAALDLPWLRATGPVLPTQRLPGPLSGTGFGLRPGATAPIGPLTVSWRAAVDLTGDAALVGQIATADWRGRCDCWSAGLWVGHERGRPAPDVMLSVTLGGI